MRIVNKRTNHDGYPAINLYHHNVWVMMKYDIKNYGKPCGGWFNGIRKLIHSLIIGWEFHNLRIKK